MEQKQITAGLTSEEIKALFFNADALREPDYKVFQLNQEGHRYYYRFENNEPKFYPSVTTLLHQTLPTSPFLIKWIADLGMEEANEKRDTAALYGTLMHAQFESVLIAGNYNFDLVEATVRKYLEDENLPEKYLSEWTIKIKKDVLSFIQFVRDYQVKPLAVEIGLVCESGKYAGCVDMPCVMTDKKGSFPAIVDFKSGRKGFYEGCELQLGLYRKMWNENFPEMPIERIFNFSPKDWRKSPTYNLKEQTEAKSLAKIPHLLAIAGIEDENRDNDITIISGVVSLEGEGFDDNLRTLSLAEVIKDRHNSEENGLF